MRSDKVEAEAIRAGHRRKTLVLNEKLKNGKRPLVIDARQPDEYRSGHIAGAKLMPLGELSHHIKELPQNKELICVCASGGRSNSATRMLSSARGLMRLT